MSSVIPNHVSAMVLQFMAGILSKKKNGELMEKLLESISSSSSEYRLLSAKCLSEYQDKEFARTVIKNHHQQFSDHGVLKFSSLNDVDCIAISFLLDVFSALNEDKAATGQHQRSEESCTVNRLEISTSSSLTLSGIKRLCESLEKEHCPITQLNISHVRLTDKSVDCISGLVCSKLTRLHMAGNYITETGVTSLCAALTHPSCKVTTLHLIVNQIADTGVTSLCDVLKDLFCKVTTLNLTQNQITDTGVTSLCDALTHPSCKVTTLHLGQNQITDTGVTSLCETLTHPSCIVTTLDLHNNQITDTSVTRLCDALTHPSCKVTTLGLSFNQITDIGVTSLCDALTQPSCKVTTPDLHSNQITDTGVTSLCEALTHPSCIVTTLDLRANQITDTGVTSLREAIQNDNCKLVELHLSWNFHPVRSEESKQSIRNLVKQHRPGFKLLI